MSNLSSQFDPFDFTNSITFQPHGEGWVPQQHEETGEEIAGAHKTFGDLILPDPDLPELDQLRIPMSAMQWSDHTGQPSRTYKLEALDEYGTFDPEALDQAGQRLLAPPVMRTVVTRPQSGIGDGPSSNVTAMAQAMGGPGSRLRTWGASWDEGRWDNPPGTRVSSDELGYSWADDKPWVAGTSSPGGPYRTPLKVLPSWPIYVSGEGATSVEGSRSSWANRSMRDLYGFYRDELEKFRGARGGYVDQGTGAQDFGEELEESEENTTVRNALIRAMNAGAAVRKRKAAERVETPPTELRDERPTLKRKRPALKMRKPNVAE